MNLTKLLNQINETHQYFSNQAQRQINSSLTLRNFVIGYYIVEYEQNGEDRAKYGQQIVRKLAEGLKDKKLRGFSYSLLQSCKQFYSEYPHVVQIIQTLSGQFENVRLIGDTNQDDDLTTDPKLLLSRLSFSHFIELMKSDSTTKRAFYEVQAIKNNWSVRELSRAMGTLLFERTGLSLDKKSLLKKIKNDSEILPDDFIKNPYVLDFLGLPEKSEFSEGDLEQAIISHLQKFLVEMGRGFCFEARQKRITFDNLHYRIDLVFYHRILKCHILVDLKLGEFSHADAGQMNLYLNYFKENEMQKNDNPPIGIILCAGKNEDLVKYATGDLSQKLFVSKYLVKLPKEIELKKIISEERKRLETANA